MSSSTGPTRRRPPRSKGKLGGGNPLTDSAEHTDPVSPLAGATWDSRNSSIDTAVPPTPLPTAETPRSAALPEPYEVDEEVTGPLNNREREHLAVCEAAIDTLRTAFWAAGRSLQVIRDGRLYREDYRTFDAYVEERWGIQRSYAHKLIRAWPLAERLEPIAPKTLNQGQVTELLPVAARHGQDAAVTVYEAIATADGVKVTASLIKGAVSILPEDYDREEVIARIRAYLEGRYNASAGHTDDSADVFAAASTKLHALATRVVRHAGDHPDQVRKFAAELRTLADQVEKELN